MYSAWEKAALAWDTIKLTAALRSEEIWADQETLPLECGDVRVNFPADQAGREPCQEFLSRAHFFLAP